MRVRVDWARKHRHLTNDQWRHAVFSDECAFDVSPPRPQFVRRAHHERVTGLHTVSHRPFLKHVMVWACFSALGTGPLSIITGTMNAAKYRSTLEDYLTPQLYAWFPNGAGVFQQDNAPCHEAHSITQFLNENGIRVLTWPPYSPDLSPIENLWAIVRNRLHTSASATKEDLINKLQVIWRDDAVRESCGALSNSSCQCSSWWPHKILIINIFT
jgi:hypothetical protein